MDKNFEEAVKNCNNRQEIVGDFYMCKATPSPCATLIDNKQCPLLIQYMQKGGK